MKVVARRKELINFYGLPDWKKGDDMFKSGGKASEILQRAKFLTSAGQAGKQNSLLIMSADLFPVESGLKAKEPHREKVHQSDSMVLAIRWMIRHKLENSIVLCFDGRCRKIRRACEEVIFGSGGRRKQAS